MSVKQIKLSCDVKLHIAVESLNEFQGSLKSLTTKRYQKLKKSILKHGFSAPIFVWKNDGKWWILDGHQRKHSVVQMKAEGYSVPDLPCVEIKASSRKEAKEKLLTYVSQFGNLDPQGLYEYVEEAEITVDELEDDYAIPEIDMEAFKKEYYGIGADDEGEEKSPSDDNEIIVTVSFANESQAQEFFQEMEDRGMKCKLIV